MGNFTINFPQGITLNHDLFLNNQTFLPGNLFIKKREINKVFDKSHSINNELIIIVLLIINLYHCKQLKNIGITMRLICYPVEIQYGHNFRVTNQSFQFIVNFFGHLKMCFISIVIFCDNTKVQEMNSLKPSSLS